MLDSLILLTMPVVFTYFMYVLILEVPFVLFGFFARKLKEKEENERQEVEQNEIGLFSGYKHNN